METTMWGFGSATIAAWIALATVFGELTHAAETDHAHGRHGRTNAMVGVMSLDVYADAGDLHLLLGRRAEGGERSLWYQRSHDGGASWARPVRVDGEAPSPQTFRRGNDAQIASSGGVLLAVWTGQGTGWGGTGRLVTAISRDGGTTWRRGPAPADDSSTGTHSFIELSAAGAGFRLAWIDSRSGEPGLRYAQSADAGASWSANATVDAQTCDCCWNSFADTGRGLLLLYRGRSPRD